MYHSCSPLPSRVPPLPFRGAYQKFVPQVPLVPFQRLKELNSSSNVRVAVEARLFGSIAMSLPLLDRVAPLRARFLFHKQKNSVRNIFASRKFARRKFSDRIAGRIQNKSSENF